MTITLRAPEVRTFPALQLVEVDATDSLSHLEGRAVPYGEWTNVGWFMEQMQFPAFEKSTKEAARGLPLLLWHDNQTWPIGVSSQWTHVDAGMDGVWDLDDSEEAQRAAKLAKEHKLTGLSVGFQPIRSEWEYVDWDDWDPDLGEDHMDKVTRVEARLLEVSLTPTPAFAGAQVSLVRSRDQRQVKQRGHAEVEAWKRWREEIRR